MNIIIGLILSVFLAPLSWAETIQGLYAHAYGEPGNQAMVFLHGGPGYNSYSFEHSNAELLAARGFYVVVFDQRGSGRSEKAPESSFNFANAVIDLREVITHFHLSKPVLLGHSYGGTLAVKYAEAFPAEVKSVVLVSAPMDQQGMVANILDRCERIYGTRSDAENLGYIQQLRQEIFGSGSYVMSHELGGLVFYHAGRCGLYAPAHLSPEAIVIWKDLRAGDGQKLLGNTAAEPFAGLTKNEGWMSKSLLPELAALRVPVAGIFGEEDGLFSRSQLQSIGKLLPAGAFRVLENASHNVFIDQRALFLDFVESVGRR